MRNLAATISPTAGGSAGKQKAFMPVATPRVRVQGFGAAERREESRSPIFWLAPERH
jgi:hypothetical protein